MDNNNVIIEVTKEEALLIIGCIVKIKQATMKLPNDENSTVTLNNLASKIQGYLVPKLTIEELNDILGKHVESK